MESINGSDLTTSYTYDKDNRVTSVTTNGVTETYTYDSYGRVTQKVTKKVTEENETVILTEAYTYKTYNGKPTTQVASHTTQNAAGTVVSSYTYSYDANGNISYSYVYNGSQLTRMTVDTQTTVDGEIVPESHVLDFTYDASGNPQTMTCDGVTYYYSVNIQGDVMAILDENGTIMVHYIRQGYGLGYYIVPSNATGSMLNKLNPFGYRGYVRDRETYLYYLESRYYSEDLCRFLNADAYTSTGQGLLGNNMFAYCRNNPVCRVDSLGTDDESCFNSETKERLVPEIEGAPTGQKTGDFPVGSNGSNPSNTNPTPANSGGYKVTTGSNGGLAVSNPKNEKTEEHHVTERCQAKKSGFSRENIDGGSNLVEVPYQLHRKISGYYSSKPGFTGGLRVRDYLAGQSFEFQTDFGWKVIKDLWEELYGGE